MSYFSVFQKSPTIIHIEKINSLAKEIEASTGVLLFFFHLLGNHIVLYFHHFKEPPEYSKVLQTDSVNYRRILRRVNFENSQQTTTKV